MYINTQYEIIYHILIFVVLSVNAGASAGLDNEPPLLRASPIPSVKLWIDYLSNSFSFTTVPLEV